MVELVEVTQIAAPPARCFDLARSIEVHLLGNTHWGEAATANTRAGLMQPGESVTWTARHFYVEQDLTSEITVFDPPHFFQDTMLEGAFQSMQHDHYFRASGYAFDGREITCMRDVFRFEAPLGPLGWIAEQSILRGYMRALLRERNRVIQQVAESDEWRRYVADAADWVEERDSPLNPSMGVAARRVG